MLEISNTEVFGFEHAIRGMRNPMNSWDKSDSYWTHVESLHTGEEVESQFIVGENDKDLMMRLAASGTDHAKFRRMIVVWMDILAPLYWWKEFDTYKVGTVANSCSTMHKIHAKEFELGDFSCEHLMDFDDLSEDRKDIDKEPALTRMDVEGQSLYFTPRGELEALIMALNHHRQRFLLTNDKKHWWQLIQLLPSSYNQKRTVMLNYEVLHNIYHARKNHKLDEWHVFCDWIESLPHSEVITLTKESYLDQFGGTVRQRVENSSYANSTLPIMEGGTMPMMANYYDEEGNFMPTEYESERDRIATAMDLSVRFEDAAREGKTSWTTEELLAYLRDYVRDIKQHK